MSYNRGGGGCDDGGDAGPDGKAIDPGTNCTINNYGTITGDIT